ncbi:hypothetical protein E2C01_042542 [Portunus trituberculatus]|uniref:Uncharacterized protein n=1 Tax=Portunus trituberculatus TaxID=210409 RepID=A0A5B7FTX3_PORTR|nr:hypothetical protein [Portunus trituberculatus]
MVNHIGDMLVNASKHLVHRTISPGTLQENTVRLHIVLRVTVITRKPMGKLEGGSSWPAVLMFTPSGAEASSAPQLWPNLLSSFNLSISLRNAGKASITMVHGGAFASSHEMEAKERVCWVADSSPLPELFAERTACYIQHGIGSKVAVTGTGTVGVVNSTSAPTWALLNRSWVVSQPAPKWVTGNGKTFPLQKDHRKKAAKLGRGPAKGKKKES